MGIKNFMKIIKLHSPSSIKIKNIVDYKNTILGIDAHLLIYKMVNAIRQNGYDIKNGDMIVTHLHTLLLKLLAFVKYDITPIFVFDGLAPQIKQATLYKRQLIYETTQKKYNEAKTDEDKQKYYMRNFITDDEINQCKQLISLFGYTIVDAIEEADSQLVELLKCKKIDFIVTDDMDILVFGGDNILKNFTVSKQKGIQEINLNIFKRDTKLTQSMIIDMAILMGCDYCSNAKGIGPINAYKLILKYKSIEELVKHEHININYKTTRAYFLKPNVIDCKNIATNVFNGIDKKKLKEFLELYKFKVDYINKLLNKF
jgi:flap endonuclease-1